MKITEITKTIIEKLQKDKTFGVTTVSSYGTAIIDDNGVVKEYIGNTKPYVFYEDEGKTELVRVNDRTERSRVFKIAR